MNCKKGHPLEGHNIFKKSIYKDSNGVRTKKFKDICRTCLYDYSHEYKRRRASGNFKSMIGKRGVAVKISRLEQLKRMRREGEKELDKARKEGWIK